MDTYGYYQQRTPQMFTPYTEEEIDRMKRETRGDGFGVTELRKYKSICTHKQNNRIVTDLKADGKIYCPICGKTFKADFTNEEVEEAVKTVLDIMETIKLQYIHAPKEVLPYYQIIPYLEDVPKLYDISCRDLAKDPNPSYGVGFVSNLINQGVENKTNTKCLNV